MLHDPHEQTLSAVGLVRHPAYVLLSADEQERRVNGWGRALAALAASGSAVRLQVLEVTLPTPAAASPAGGTPTASTPTPHHGRSPSTTS